MAESKDYTIMVQRTVPGLGDAVMFEPVLRRLKERGENVCVATPYPDVFNMTYDTVDKPPDYLSKDNVIDLGLPCPCALYESKTDKIKKGRIELFLERAGLEYKNDIPKIRLDPVEKNYLNPKIGVALVSARYGELNDGWRDYPYINALIERLKKVGDITWFHTESVVLDNVHNFKGSVKELIHAINSMEYMVTIDSAAAHIAGALSIPQYSIFGPTDPTLRVSQYPNTNFAPKYEKCGKSYCWYNPCRDRFCLTTLSPKHIVKQVTNHLKELSEEKVNAIRTWWWKEPVSRFF